MKVGDLVQPTTGKEFPEEPQVGIIIEVIDYTDAGAICKVLWTGGVIDEEWTNELEVVNESR